jgi:hypothetical protein
MWLKTLVTGGILLFCTLGMTELAGVPPRCAFKACMGLDAAISKQHINLPERAQETHDAPIQENQLRNEVGG